MKAAVVLRWEQKNGCPQLLYRMFYFKSTLRAREMEMGEKIWGGREVD